MQIKKLDGGLFKTLVINGAENLKLNYQIVDELNVFPVPDGDTGTNMKMTIEGGVAEIYNSHDTNIYDISKKLSRGMLMGARGNSGVILSQLFRGISKGFEGYEQVDAIRLAEAFSSGVKQAYKAVMKPVEGTVLTVAREASEKMLAISSSRMTINEFFKEYVAELKESLSRTPELLPQLKEANVVDSGGAGYVYIVEGMLKYLDGEVLSKSNFATVAVNDNHKDITSEEGFGYCTEFILQLRKEINPETFDEKVILNKLAEIGESIVIVKDEDVVKVHVHSQTPGKILNIGQEYGEFLTIKVENMTVQHNENQEIKHVAEGKCACGEEHLPPVQKPEVRSKYAVVAVASGEGLTKTFTELGVDYVVSGGQSMNPSTESFIRGFDSLNAEHIIVFPNNKNIILAANQAAKIYTESKVHVVETKTLAQGFSCLVMLDLSLEPEEILSEMKETIGRVTTGLITYSIRDTQVEGVKIKKDDYIGILNGKIVVSKHRRMDAVRQMLTQGITADKEIVTVIYGDTVTQKEVNDLVKYIEKNFPAVEVDVIEGNQEVYSYILAIE